MDKSAKFHFFTFFEVILAQKLKEHGLGKIAEIARIYSFGDPYL
jgi:hypothetical protein